MSIEDILYREEGCNAAGARTYYISFRPNGSSAPTVYFGAGISAVAYVTGSIVTFTMTDGGWTRLLDFSFGVQTAAGDAAIGTTLELDTTNTNLDTGVIAVATTNAAGTRADVASDSTTMCYFRVVVSKNPLDS